MKLFVLITGLLSVLSGLSLQFASVASKLMPLDHPGMLTHLFGCMAMFLGVMLIICSRNLADRSPLVIWEGLLRVAGFAVMAGYGLWGGGGLMLVVAGGFDLTVALIYFVGLPALLGVTLLDLMLDRNAVKPA